ncbi:MAG: NADH-quinone oxidoreductase subunit N, partial [Anaerolineae bacterium]|nr:NADH-quinone oxidoreductase subunit N [Anaerolineae bacterium]
ASISSYILAGFYKADDRSAEAGMKYFVYGAFATAVMLFGMSYLYGIFGSTNIYILGLIVQNPTLQSSMTAAGFSFQDFTAVNLVAVVLIVVGFGFKISAVPFHWWAPDTYEGAPTAFTAFVSTASKAAGFAIFLRVFTAGVFGAPTSVTANQEPWWALLVVICIITMTLGNLSAIFQKNIKRMLAYSSVAQAGYALIGLIIFTQAGYGASMFYLLMYAFTNIAAFGVIIIVSNVSQSDQMEDLYGLNRRSPYLALVMMVALLSLGGIPPTAGFLGKFFLFKAAVDAGYWWLAAIGIFNAFVALYYYLTVIKYMYLYRSDAEAIEIPVSRAAIMGLGITTLVVIILGVYAGPAYEWTLQAAASFMTLAGG